MVERLVAVQGQELAEARWSVAQRARDATEAGVERALASGALVRTHVLRPTWHLVAAADVRWLLALTAPRVHRLNASIYRQEGLDGATLARAHSVFERELGAGEPRTRPELAAALAGAGIHAEGVRLAYVVMHAELEGLVGSGPRRGRRHTYVLLDTPDVRPADPLAELCRRFFTARGPASAADLAAWSGLTLTDVRTGLAAVEPELAGVDAGDGVERWAAPVAARRRPGFPRALLLGTYDELLVGHREPRVVLAHPLPRPALERAVLVDGRTVGTWRRTLSARAVGVEVAPFGPLAPGAAEAIAAEVERFAAFLERPATLTLTPP